MQTVSDELLRTLADLDDQHGQFFDTYRTFQSDSAAHAAAAGRLASAMGVGMQIASTIVQMVHDITRDALTQLAGTAISAATTAACTLGFGTPWAVAQVTTRVSSLASKVGKFITRLIRAIKALLPRLKEAAKVFGKLRKALDEALESGKGALRTAVHKGDDLVDDLPTPSPAVRAPHAAARTGDDTFLDLVESGRAEAPGYRPSYADDVDTVVTFFDLKVKDAIEAGRPPTLGRDGSAVFLMPVEDANLVSSVEDAVIATGAAPSVKEAWRQGADVYGLEVPAEGLDIRVPTRVDADGYPHFVEGGYTATAENGLFTLNRIREVTVSGGGVMPPGSVLFRLMPNGFRMPVRVF